jgi:hypothetical protein
MEKAISVLRSWVPLVDSDAPSSLSKIGGASGCATTGGGSDGQSLPVTLSFELQSQLAPVQPKLQLLPLQSRAH